MTRHRRRLTRSLPRYAALAILAALCGCGQAPKNTDWAVLGNGDDAQFHSDLKQIDRGNATELGLAWVGEIPTEDGLVGNPLVKDGLVFQSGGLGRVYASDVRTGELVWRYEPEHDFSKMDFNALWTVRINRGAALTDKHVIVGTYDCKVIAFDQKTGQKAWEVPSCDTKPGSLEGITGAPRVGGGKIFVGNHCGESGLLRGFVEALDERTGRRLWRFYTVPGDPSRPQSDPVMTKAATTWGTDWYSKTKGCGSVWDAMTYDAKLDRLYIGTGGPAPWPLDRRAADAGDELFTNAIVAIDAKTGKYIWHYTVTPNDAWNLEATMNMVVTDMEIDGKLRRVVMQAPKNGFFYVLDAETGEFISAKNPVPVNWAFGIDQRTGRPIPNPAARYWEKPEGAVVLPGPLGAHGTAPMAYDPVQQLVFVPFDNIPTLMKSNATYGPGAIDEMYGFESRYPGMHRYSDLVAWDPIKQSARWRVRSDSLINGGVLHTAGGLVFQGTSDGHFNVYDDRTGKRLWSFPVQGSIRAAPSTVMVDGEQYVLVATGNGNSMVSSRYVSPSASTPMTRAAPSRLLAFKLGGAATLPALTPALLAKPDFPEPSPALARRGALVFEENGCALCHGREAVAVGGSIPDLRHSTTGSFAMFDQIVRSGLLQPRGMPKFDRLSSPDLEALKAYIQMRSWQDYKEQTKKPAR